ncbi:MAG: type II toxin-antitoxin system RelE/ParE family toxin [Gemmatimonadaceae bacterium]
MTHEVLWSGTARDQIQSIARYIARNSPVYAERWVDRILERAEQIARFPESGRHLRGAPPNVRELIEGEYRIVYLAQPSRVDILAVVHGRRELYWASIESQK